LKKFNTPDTKPMKTQMHTFEIISKDGNGKKVDQMIYRGMIGSLLYLTSSRSNNMHNVGTTNLLNIFFGILWEPRICV